MFQLPSFTTELKEEKNPVTILSTGRRPALPADVEETIANCLIARARMGWPSDEKELCNLLSEYVITKNLKTPFKNNIPGHDWYLGFMKRHPNLSFKKPEHLQIIRKDARDPFVVYDFYKKLQDLITEKSLKYPNKSCFIFHADESGFSSDPSRVALAENQPLACIAADGSYLPPFIVFKGSAVQARWRSEQAIGGTLYGASKNGWMEEPHFYHWFETSFILEVKTHRLSMDKESAQKKKRERAVNFTELEIRHLVDVAIKYSKIIENKQTDGAMWKEKDKAWAEIAVEFNAITGGIHRTAKVLRLKYDGIKRGLKQKQTKNKLEVFKTGGGAPNIQPLSDCEEKLLQFMTLSVHGLPAAGGNDSDIILPSSCTTEVSEPITRETQGILLSGDILEEAEIYQEVSEPIVMEVEDVTSTQQKNNTTVDEHHLVSNWSSWNPVQLREKKHTSLGTPQKKRVGKHTLNEKIDSLTDSRKELLQLQTQIAEHEVLQKQEFADMQKKILLDRDQREQLQHDMIMKNLNLQQQLLLDTNERQQKEHDLHVQWMLLKIENEKADLLIKEKQLQ
ncbi:hypothetical protein MML48_9g00003643 [Holotrichia oblita]|uniref:Uncharacterized protein n=1 Tax=Holotrichia oblita TaxID=644536 RepID=A0ACB9SJD0_HOLOL|nr:hypothetical protein MML48_9g00003643 [Holotrichia oblita]